MPLSCQPAARNWPLVATRTQIRLPSRCYSRVGLALLLVLLILTGRGRAASSQPVTRYASRIVETKSGQIRGILQELNSRHLDPVEVFRGIPYAAPPIGELRFRPPISPIPWNGVKLADTFGAVCPQNYPDLANDTAALLQMPQGRYQQIKKMIVFLANQNEDCLFLNLYIPGSGKRVTVGLLRQLHTRDLRRQFCPANHWIASNVVIPIDKPQDFAFRRRRLRGYVPFQNLRAFTREEFEEGPPLSATEVRTLTLLREIPFVVPFNNRVVVFQSLIYKDKREQQGELTHFMQGPSIQISVRRNYLYEDAFEKLSRENEPELRLKMRVQLVNTAGLEEAGVDGGGLFREFLSELLKTSFDPNRGFFKLTKDNMLYPNPTVQLLVDDFPKHYYFIGRILGKALYENLLVELPFAEFFLSKIVGRQSDVDVHHLASLDPIMYRNLLYLKSYMGDVADLNLDFTVLSDELGERRVDELKPSGANIPVTNHNRIEYIHLMADYKLNKQIRAQCYAFKQGIGSVVPLDWLQMFNNKELQVLISGAQIPVDVNDLKLHTNYTGGYASDHPTITAFWKVVSEFNDQQKGQLLKFVTSCSRPPLLGFKPHYNHDI
ncbi:ubiquitin-protein ligase e3c-like protein [Lasius niger]|uniref:HECT-type E3 ubiquitin transferase n=1 Tax=Lasius niger TaxID=67767 RepID=A0A0J7L4X4_LASNI|nr:ubiquitin-protein ligase e3c-like protein [Lasius niger]